MRNATLGVWCPEEDQGRLVSASREQIMGVITPDTDTVRPSLIEDITDKKAKPMKKSSYNPLAPQFSQAATDLSKNVTSSDWIDTTRKVDISGLFLGPIHKIYHQRTAGMMPNGQPLIDFEAQLSSFTGTFAIGRVNSWIR